VPVNESHLVVYVGLLAVEAGGGEEVSVSGIISTVLFSRVCCGKIVLRRSGIADC
jgi:hypothetical protein